MPGEHNFWFVRLRNEKHAHGPQQRVNRQPLLLAAAVVFWGWQSDSLMYAVLMAAALEAALFVKTRMGFRDTDFERISDLCAVLLTGLTVYQFDQHGFQAIFAILESSPVVFYPLVLAQRWSTRQWISHSALFRSVRRAIKKGRIKAVGTIDIEYVFFILCLLAASAGTAGEPFFFLGLVVLTGWALWRHRPPGFRLSAWALAAGFPVLLAFGGQTGVAALRTSLEPLLVQIFQERFWAWRNPYQGRTEIGHIGRLKASQRIVARVYPHEGGVFPARVREAVYQTYSRQSWFARDASFTEIAARGAGTIFNFKNSRAMVDTSGVESHQVSIASALRRGRGMLMMPNGTGVISGLNVNRVSRNPLGSTKVDEGPDLIEFIAQFGEAESYVDPPGFADQDIPEFAEGLFQELAHRLGLQGVVPAEVVRRVQAHFKEGFRYSLVRRGRFGVEVPPLHRFLNVTKEGHCEYFATATVLLLRAAGVPARYVSGYAVNEWSPLEGAFIVRRRHAHSWASVYIDGVWRDVDTTPKIWVDAESEGEPWWLDTYDAFAWLSFQFNRWRYRDSDWIDAQTLIAVAILLSGVLAWRLARTTELVRDQEVGQQSPTRPGVHPEVCEIERYLAKVIGIRALGETWWSWLDRLTTDGSTIPSERLLRHEILPRYYRNRFDPLGLGLEERQALERAARVWLDNAVSNEEKQRPG